MHAHALSHPHLHTYAHTQTRVFDFVVQQQGLFKSVPDAVRATICHWGTVMFDHESETVTLDMVGFDS